MATDGGFPPDKASRNSSRFLAPQTGGSTWDAAGGLPDPFVAVSLNGTAIAVSSAVQDTLAPLWNEFVNSVIPAGSTFSITVYDEDLASDDLMWSCGNVLSYRVTL
jgi:Ca2+-dependent lipid-binding protein